MHKSYCEILDPTHMSHEDWTKVFWMVLKSTESWLYKSPDPLLLEQQHLFTLKIDPKTLQDLMAGWTLQPSSMNQVYCTLWWVCRCPDSHNWRLPNNNFLRFSNAMTSKTFQYWWVSCSTGNSSLVLEKDSQTSGMGKKGVAQVNCHSCLQYIGWNIGLRDLC